MKSWGLLMRMARRCAIAAACALPLFVIWTDTAKATLLMVDLTINFVPPTPIFPTLTGSAQFYSYDPTQDPLVFTDYLSPFNIGTLTPNGSFETVFTPTDPCFGDGSCGLAFDFSGVSATFPALTFADGVTPPLIVPDITPILPLGNFIPTEPCAPTDPCRQTGNIVAFDDATVVGTWEVTETTVPEPASLAIFGTGLAWLGVMRRKRKPN